MHISAEDTRICSKDCILEPKHIWIKAKDITVHPSLKNVGGIEGCYRPPVAAPSLSVKMFLNDQVVKPSGYVWQVDCFERWGYLGDMQVRTFLVPASGRGYVQKVVLTNESNEALSAHIKFHIEGSLEVLPSGKWGWMPPSASGDIATSVEPNGLSIGCGSASATFRCDLESSYESNSISASICLQSQSELVFYLQCSLGDTCLQNLHSLFFQSQQENKDAYRSTVEAFPVLLSSDKQLESFYNKGLTSFHTCIWESDSFVFSPFMAESGIDGGAVCNYPWGIAYICKLLALGHPEWLKKHILQILKTDLRHHYAYTPLDGKPVGPWYSYNQYSIIACAYHYVNGTGDTDFLHQEVNGKTVFEHLKDNACFGDDLSLPAALIDYGTNENLLELKRTNDYEHYVPSPNAERCWSYRAVAELGQLIGESTDRFMARADELKAHIIDRLWDTETGWLTSRNNDGNRKPGWSIQVFDTLRTGLLDPEKTKALAKHLNEDEFLSEYGVHSLSKIDPGYDANDVDWGGPGVYAGDGPELVEDLYISGCFNEGDDLLKRLLWWGDRLPYYPQAILADAVGYRLDGRANIVAGLKANECIVFGLLGLKIHAESAQIRPHLPSFLTDYQIEDLKLRDTRIDIEVAADGYQVSTNGKKDLQRHALGQPLEIPI